MDAGELVEGEALGPPASQAEAAVDPPEPVAVVKVAPLG